MWYSRIATEVDQNSTMQARVTAEADSPWFSGHFPGDPILPGIAQLSMVTESLRTVFGKNGSLESVSRIKFKKIIRPGDIMDIKIRAGGKNNHYSFTISSEHQEVCSGRLVLAPNKGATTTP